ncbi:hypothetical protein OG216_46680 (plasmid) [Streptomycetaceae bacterium NBC_01309]
MGTVGDNPIAPGVLCLPSVWGSLPLGASGAGAPLGTELLVTSYEAGPNDATFAHMNETIATFATEAEAQAAEAKLAEAAASCQASYPGASLTQLGTPDAPLWKWDHAPDSYRGFEGFTRSGKTIVTIGYLQGGGAFAAEFGPQVLQTAIGRATS